MPQRLRAALAESVKISHNLDTSNLVFPHKQKQANIFLKKGNQLWYDFLGRVCQIRKKSTW